MSKQYVLYDSRAMTMPTDECTVFEMSKDINELRASAKDYGGGAIYSYDELKEYPHYQLINEKFEEYVDA